MLKNSTLNENNLVDKGAISGAAKGRAAFVRFKARGGDFALLGAYFPPKPNTKSELTKYLETCELVAEWLSDTIESFPNRCSPFISVDLNDGIGKTKVGSRYECNGTSVICRTASRIEKFENGAGAQFRRVCEKWGLVVHTANYDDRCTWFS